MDYRRPFLEGDNWWRGHAAAFLKFINLPPETLRKGRVCQVRLHFICYFCSEVTENITFYDNMRLTSCHFFSIIKLMHF